MEALPGRRIFSGSSLGTMGLSWWGGGWSQGLNSVVDGRQDDTIDVIESAETVGKFVVWSAF